MYNMEIPLVLLMLVCFHPSLSQKSKPYFLTMRDTIRPGQDMDIFVHILNGKSTIHASLMDSSWNEIAQDTGVVKARNSPKKLTVSVPTSLASGSYTFFITGTGSVSFEQNVTVSLSTKTSSILIQTDQRIYKPGQKVMFKCLGIYPDLTMVNNEPFDVIITDPKGNRIKQWISVTPESCVFEGSFILTEFTNLGEWKLQCSQLSASEEKIFDVDEVVFPRFEVTMDIPAVPLVTDSELIIPVSAQYTFGKSVKGTLELTYQNANDERRMLTKSFPEIDGTRNANVDMQELLDSVGQNIIVTATVTETLTGQQQSDSQEMQIYRVPETLVFSPSLAKVFKPGCDFIAILRLVQPDGNPVPGAAGQTITVDVTYQTPVTQSSNSEDERIIFPNPRPTEQQKLDPILLEIPADGIIDFDFSLPMEAESASIQACFKETCAYLSLTRAESPSNSYLQLTLLSDMDQLKAGKTVEIRLKSTRKIKWAMYQVISKRLGDIIDCGRIKSKQKTKLHDWSIKLTHAMTPSCTLVVYYVYKNEIVADSITLNINGIMDKHEVSLKFSKESVEPAESVNLKVNAASCADVHVLAVDKRTLLLKTGNDITQNDVVAELLRYGDVANSPFPVPMRWFWFFPVPVNGLDAFSIFNDAKLAAVTNLELYKHTEDFPLFLRNEAMENSASAPSGGKARVRKNFPETWLYMKMKSGQTRTLTAPDAITTYVASAFAVCCEKNKGLGVAANPASLTVFQEMFARMTLPYSAVRGEILIVQVDVFNYGNTAKNFIVKFKKSQKRYAFVNGNGDDFNPPNRFLTKEVFVAADGSGTLYFAIKLLKIGDIPLLVKVEVENEGEVDALKRVLLVKAEGVQQSYNIVKLKEVNSETVTTDVQITFPPGAVEGSQQIQVSVIGDVLGSALAGIEDLLQMSYGCGEQNLVGFVPNVYVRSYLENTGRLTAQHESDSTEFISQGYQRELTFRRSDGSFSAFGNNDSDGSTWLTAFVVKSFAEAKDVVYIDPAVMASAIQWLIAQQNEDGTIQEPGRVIHKSMQGGSIGSPVSSAAYVVIALMEARRHNFVQQNMQEDVNNAISLTLDMLRNAQLNNMYEMAIVLYALTLDNPATVASLLDDMNDLAIEEDGKKYWTLPPDQIDDVSGWESWQPPVSQARALDIEMTSYVLLALVELAVTQGFSEPLKVMKWIVEQQSASGGFVSTQDTVVALQALTAVAARVFSDSASLTITASDPDGDFTKIFTINSGNAIVKQIAEVPSDVRTLSVVATGTGICILEVAVRYNILHDVRVPAYELEATPSEETDNGYLLTICFRWLRSDPSTMSLLNVDFPSGMEGDIESLDTDSLSLVKKIGRVGTSVDIYFDYIPRRRRCFTIYVRRIEYVYRPKPAVCTLTDYYEPTNLALVEYLPDILQNQSENEFCERAGCE